MNHIPSKRRGGQQHGGNASQRSSIAGTNNNVNASQRIIAGGTSCNDNGSQRSSDHSTGEVNGGATKRGRQKKSRTQLKMPSRAGKIALRPNGDNDQFLTKRRRGQEARFKSEDVAQNRSGSRSYSETQQYLEHKFGPENATCLKTYTVMKSGVKNVDSSGSSGPICSKKTQKRIIDYSAAASAQHPDGEWEQQPLDEAILYNTNGGLPHGRVPIGNDAIKKADVLISAKSRNIKPSNSTSYRNVVRHNQELLRTQEIHRQMIVMLFQKMGEEPPPEVLRRETSAQSQSDNKQCSSERVDSC